MFRPSALLIAGAVIMTAGAAHAQQSPQPAFSGLSDATAARVAMPWYQRFTTSNGLTEGVTGDPENDRLPPPAWTLNQRWGVTVDVREAQRLERSPEGGRGDQTALGAYYQFTPRVRVGGEVSLETQRPGPTPAHEEEARAGVRIESAFRF